MDTEILGVIVGLGIVGVIVGFGLWASNGLGGTKTNKEDPVGAETDEDDEEYMKARISHLEEELKNERKRVTEAEVFTNNEEENYIQRELFLENEGDTMDDEMAKSGYFWLSFWAALLVVVVYDGLFPVHGVITNGAVHDSLTLEAVGWYSWKVEFEDSGFLTIYRDILIATLVGGWWMVIRGRKAVILSIFLGSIGLLAYLILLWYSDVSGVPLGKGWTDKSLGLWLVAHTAEYRYPSNYLEQYGVLLSLFCGVVWLKWMVMMSCFTDVNTKNINRVDWAVLLFITSFTISQWFF